MWNELRRLNLLIPISVVAIRGLILLLVVIVDAARESSRTPRVATPTPSPTYTYTFTPIPKPSPTPTPEPTLSAIPKFAIINRYAFVLEVASDEATRARGLRNRTALPEYSAMLFIFL